MGRATLLVFGLCSIAIAPHLCAADDDAPPVTRKSPPGMERISAIGGELRKLGDWDAMYEMAAPGIDSFWETRGWNDEADLFALQTVQEVASIPPWEFNKRIDHLMGAVRRRYDLSDEQYLDMQSKAYGLIGAMAWRHGGTVFKQASEAVQTRAQNKPFSRDQIARWTLESEDLFDEMRRQFERITMDLSQSFTPEQREILERDFASYQRRMQAVNELRDRWAAGQWQPEDWALQNDPLHEPVIAEREARQLRAQAVREMNVPYAPLDESTWSKYARWFIRRYQLDDAQANAALSILHELEARAADYRSRHRNELRAVAQEDRATDPAYAPIQSLFEELKHRLHPIPTLAQRRHADEPPPPEPGNPNNARTPEGARIPPE